MRYAWSKLNRLQKGTYGEYLAKMEFVMYGYLVFTAEIDDRGIDFVVRNDQGVHYDVQVKTVTKGNYTWITRSKFVKSLWVCLVCLTEGNPPALYLFSGHDWDRDKSGLLQHRKYPSAKESEYGFHFTKKREAHLETYRFDISAERLRDKMS